MATLTQVRSPGFFVAVALLLAPVASAASAPVKAAVTFDHTSLLATPVPVLQWSGFGGAAAISSIEGFIINPVSIDQETLASVLGPNQSTVGLDLVPAPGVIGSDDGIQADPRPQMKKLMLAALLLGALVRYLISPSYLRFARQVRDPWES